MMRIWRNVEAESFDRAGAGWDLEFDPATAAYDTIREWFMRQLTGSADAAEYGSGNLATLFNEYHALIVRHGKEHCATKPKCQDCPLAADCARYRTE